MQTKIKEIRAGLRLMMNGVTSTAMRERGINYSLNFGVEIPRLRQFAKKYAPDVGLAEALWNENVRELRILATLIYPPESFVRAEEWVRSISHLELAEQASMNLFSKTPGIRLYAFRWIGDENALVRLCGFLTITRMMMNGCVLTDEEGKALLPAAVDAFYGGALWMQTAVVNTLLRFMRQTEAQKDVLSTYLSDKKELMDLLV